MSEYGQKLLKELEEEDWRCENARQLNSEMYSKKPATFSQSILQFIFKCNKKGATTRQIAKWVGTDHSQISKIIRGERCWDSNTCLLTTDDLFNPKRIRWPSAMILRAERDYWYEPYDYNDECEESS